MKDGQCSCQGSHNVLCHMLPSASGLLHCRGCAPLERGLNDGIALPRATTWGSHRLLYVVSCGSPVVTQSLEL
jgi:hypothetical protein